MPRSDHARIQTSAAPTQAQIEKDVQSLASEAQPGDESTFSHPRVAAIDRYDQLEEERKRASRLLRATLGHPEEPDRRRDLARAQARREAHLGYLLALLPFAWHVEHAYAARETATYGGADHIVVDQDVQIGRTTRRAGDTLARARRAFRGLHRVEEGRLPNSAADLRTAERIVFGGATASTGRQSPGLARNPRER